MSDFITFRGAIMRWARSLARKPMPATKPKTYLAGPMTGIEGLNFPAFHAEAARLRALGFEVVNPAEVNPDPTTPWTDCMFRDLAELTTCDRIVMLPGWEASPGAQIERLWSIRTGKQVHAAGELWGAG